MLEPEKIQLNINKKYYQNSIPMINESQSRQNKVKTIRLFSASNSYQKNKKYESQEKLKIYKDNSILNNFKSTKNRPTSVKQTHQNYIYPQKRKIINNSEMNYPQLTLNSINIQVNNVPLQRRRKIVYEEDNELADEYDILRKIWKDAGVTDAYIDNFETITNNEKNTRSEILQSLKNEEQQMIKFKEEMLKVVSEIIKRENDIKNIKIINKKYLNVKTRLNLIINPKKNIKNNNFIKEKDEKNNEENENNEKNKELKKQLEEEKNKIEEEIEACLASLRLHGINVVTVMKKFNMRYEHLLNAGKVDLEFLKKKYGFDKNYLLKLKTDLDFLKDTDIGDLYHFSQKGKDPFLISISVDDQKENEDKTYKYKILPISEDMDKQIKFFNHLLNEVEIFTMMKNDYTISNNISNNFSQYKYGGFFNGISKNNDSSYFFDSKFKTVNNLTNITPIIRDSKITFNTIQSKQKMQNRKSDFSSTFKPIKLIDDKKSQNQIEKLKKNLAGPYISKVDNSSETNNNYNNNYNSKTIQMPKIKTNKSKSLIDEESSTSNPDDEIVKEVQSRVNKEVINKLYEVENRVKKQVEGKLKKDQERIEEEERRLKKEKEKIEELRKIEEEKRKKDKEKWEKIEKERIKREMEEKKKFEEEEKIKKEENEQFRKDIEQKFLKEIEKRFKKEENERKRREEENNLIKKELELKIKYELEQERIKREREEKEKAEIKERIRLEEIEKIKNAVRKDEYDRIRRQEIDKIDKEREERKQREEFERKRKEEEERMKKEIERLKRENEERKEKANDDKKRREQEEIERKEREKKLYEEIERLKKEELIKINLEKEIELQKKAAEEKEKQYKKDLKEIQKKEKRSKSKEKDKKRGKSNEKDNNREKSKSKSKDKSKSKEKEEKKYKNDNNKNKNIGSSSVSLSEQPPSKKKKKRQIKRGISS